MTQIQTICAAVVLALSIAVAGWRLARRLLGSGAPPAAAFVSGAFGLGLLAGLVLAEAPLQAAAGGALSGLVWSLALIDGAAHRLPDPLTATLGAAGLAVSAAGGEGLAAVTAAGAGFLVFALVAWTFRRASGRDGLGMGDAKLAAAAGAWVGHEGLAHVVLGASIVGIAWVLARALARGGAALREPIAFGVPLCAALWVTWLLQAAG